MMMAESKQLVIQPEEVPASASQPIEMLAMIREMAVNPAVDAAKLAALFDLKDRIDAIEAKRQFEVAMQRLQSRMPRIVKRGVIDLGKGKPLPFAKFEDVWAYCQPIMSEEGFTARFPLKVGDRIVVRCLISHMAGHTEESEFSGPPDTGPGRNGLQAIGSTVSYLKRYLLKSALNIIDADEDDDGRAAGAITEKQLQQIEDMLEAIKDTHPKALQGFKNYMGVEKLVQIQAADFGKAIAALKSKAGAK
jgi:hypothetical protein